MNTKIEMLKNSFVNYFPMIFFVILAQGLRRSHGALKSNHLTFITLSLILIYFFTFIKKVNFKVTTLKWFKIIFAAFSVFWVVKNEIIYPHEGLGSDINRFFVWMNCICVFLILVFDWKKIKTKYLYWVIAIGQVLIFLTIPFSSPNPVVDVYTIMSEGVDHLLSGRNPYRYSYPDIYNGLYEYVPRFIYWPVVTYGFTLSRFIFTDIRAIFLIIYGLISIFHYRRFFSNGDTKELSLVKTLIWTSFPVSLFVIEQTWVEVFLIPFTFFHFLYLSKKEWIKAGLFLGIMCATKQFLIFTCILSFFYVYKIGGLKKALVLTLTCCSSMLLLMMPFLIWDSSAFIENTVMQFLSYPPRWDSLSWVAHFKRSYDIYLNSSITGIIYLLATLISIVTIFKTVMDVNKLLTLSIFLYGIVFIFGKQSFCNYYFFLAYFLYLLLTNIYKKIGTN